MSNSARQILDSILNNTALLERLDSALSQRTAQNAQSQSGVEQEIGQLFNLPNANRNVSGGPAFQFTHNFGGLASRGVINVR